jgi:isochorismate synthase
LNNLFDKITAHYTKKLPFTVFRKPNSEIVSAFLMPDTELNFVSNFEEKGFVFAPFSSGEKVILFPANKGLRLSAKAQLESYHLKDTVSRTNPLSKERHQKTVERAIEKINTSALQKVVISREELVDITNFDLIEIYKKLLSTYTNAFVYTWFHPQVGLWFGATPETLLSLTGTTFKTMSLAGTQVCHKSEQVIWKSKELEEQQLVTNFIEDQLEKIATNLEIDKTETVKAGNLLHLRTKVSGDLKETSSLEELIRALHPTPAVCGLPREAASTFILKNENYDRSFYTGFLGELNIQHSNKDEKSTSLFVNLRCMKIEQNKASIFVGGGITKDSNAEKEWEETVSKSKTMKRVL